MEKEFQKINKKLDKIVALLEEKLSGKRKVLKGNGIENPEKYKGLKGGMKFITDQGFLDKPKSFPEIIEELKRHTYHYPRTTVQPLLISLCRPGGALMRIKNEGKYNYVIRK